MELLHGGTHIREQAGHLRLTDRNGSPAMNAICVCGPAAFPGCGQEYGRRRAIPGLLAALSADGCLRWLPQSFRSRPSLRFGHVAGLVSAMRRRRRSPLGRTTALRLDDSGYHLGLAQPRFAQQASMWTPRLGPATSRARLHHAAGALRRDLHGVRTDYDAALTDSCSLSRCRTWYARGGQPQDGGDLCLQRPANETTNGSMYGQSELDDIRARAGTRRTA